MDSYNQRQDIFNLTIDEEAKAHLLETARWTKFLAIVGFVSLGLMILVGLFAAVGISAMSSMYADTPLGPGFGTIIMLAYVATALFTFFPVFYLYKYSVLVKPGILNSNQEQFNLALSYQRRMFKFMGILTLVILGLYAVGIVFGLIGAAIGSM